MATWYVRPDASHGGTNNGTSYNNAWQGWSSIVWGISGVQGGDTLYVCGTHNYSSTISIGTHTGSSLATICTIRGDFEKDAGKFIFTGSSFLNTNAKSYTTIRNLEISPGSSVGIYINGTQSNITIDNVNILTGSSGSSAISFNASGGATYNDITNSFYRNPPTIGAYQYNPPRAVVTNRGIR